MNPKDRIIETASRLFYEQGYNSTGINQIIKEAEVAKASLYQYFPSKDVLLLEYLKVAGQSTSETLNLVVENIEDPKLKVVALFDFIEKYSRQTTFQGCVFLNIASEIPKENKKANALIKKQKDGIRSLFASILAPVGKADLADELYVLFDGALITTKIHDEMWPLTITKKIVEKLL